MDHSPLKSNNTKRNTLICVALVLCAAASIEIYRVVEERAAASEAAQWRVRASNAATPSLTLEAARDWLKQNNFRVVSWNLRDANRFVGQEESSTDGNHLIVLGQRDIREGNWLMRPSMINLRFRFSPTGQFSDVTADTSETALPSQPATKSSLSTIEPNDRRSGS